MHKVLGEHDALAVPQRREGGQFVDTIEPTVQDAEQHALSGGAGAVEQVPVQHAQLPEALTIGGLINRIDAVLQHHRELGPLAHRSGPSIVHAPHRAHEGQPVQRVQRQGVRAADGGAVLPAAGAQHQEVAGLLQRRHERGVHRQVQGIERDALTDAPFDRARTEEGGWVVEAVGRTPLVVELDEVGGRRRLGRGPS